MIVAWRSVVVLLQLFDIVNSLDDSGSLQAGAKVCTINQANANKLLLISKLLPIRTLLMLSLLVERMIFTINIYDIAGIQAITNATPATDVDTDVETDVKTNFKLTLVWMLLPIWTLLMLRTLYNTKTFTDTSILIVFRLVPRFPLSFHNSTYSISHSTVFVLMGRKERISRISGNQ